jgi:hypothetical protein
MVRETKRGSDRRLRYMDTEIQPMKEIERGRGRQPMIKTREINRKYATLATKVVL